MKAGQERRGKKALNGRAQRARRCVWWMRSKYLCFHCYLLFIFSVSIPSVSTAFEPVRAELGKESA